MTMPIFAYGKLKPLRQAKGLNQSEMAAELGISRPTYLLMEQGGKEPTLTQLYTLARLLGVAVNDLCLNLSSGEATVMDYIKFKEMIASTIMHGAQDGAISKTKLAILAYLIDFAWYFLHHQPMTGATYRPTARGPVADDFFRAVDDLYEGQHISLEPKGTSLVIRAIEQLPTTKLNGEELSLIHDVGNKWRRASTAELLTFGLQQGPNKSTRLGEPIPYESVLAMSKNPLY